MVDWATLPKELLGLIAQHIVHIEDFVVFGSVCKPWQSAITLEEKPTSPPKFPWLMLADDQKPLQHIGRDDCINNIHDLIVEEDANRLPPRGFFDTFSSKLYEFDLPEACWRKCLGTSFGWLLTIGYDLKLNLLHPFSRHQICLPPQTTFSLQYNNPEIQTILGLAIFVSKAVLSSPPLPLVKTANQNNDNYHKQQEEDCIIMAIYGEYSILAFAKVGRDKSWTDVQVPSRSYDDVIYYKGRFYAVNCNGSVVVCDINDAHHPSATVIAPLPFKSSNSYKKYLVESSGDLLLVSRIYGGSRYDRNYEGDRDSDEEEGKTYYTRVFSVLKMEERCVVVEEDEDGANEYPYIWVKVNNLGNRALFLGNNSSVSLAAPSSSKEESYGHDQYLKANCIYFTDDNLEQFPHVGGGLDMGIYNMEDGIIERHYTGPSRSKYSPPLWYI